MPLMDDVYGGNTLKAEDVPPTFKAVMTVERVTVQVFSDKNDKDAKEKKLVLHFQGKEKGLALNVTNANMMAEISQSRDYDYWPGVKVLLYRTTTDYAGRRVPALRLDHANGTAAAPPSRPTPPPPPPPSRMQEPPPDDFQVTDDDVPFSLSAIAVLPLLGAFLA